MLYNWGGNSAYGGENGTYNMVNNYYKPGPATQSSKNKRIVQVSFEADPQFGVGYGKFFINGNYVYNNPTVTADNWAGGVEYDSGIPVDQRPNVRLQAPIDYHMATEHTAVQAYEAVLAQVGASLKRDAVDARIIEEVRSGTATYGGAYGAAKGIIDTQETVGGWPELSSQPAPADADKDGMPDAWENQQGLNPNNPEDRNADADNDGYTNLEEYLNSITTAVVTGTLEEAGAFENKVYPNPFSESTSFSFTSTQKAKVILTISDLSGRNITTLLDKILPAGAHRVEWNGTDAQAKKLPAGMYLYVLQIGKERVVKRLALVRK